MYASIYQKTKRRNETCDEKVSCDYIVSCDKKDNPNTGLRKEENNIYFLFALWKEWELASFLQTLRMTQAMIDKFLHLNIVSCPLITHPSLSSFSPDGMRMVGVSLGGMCVPR